MSIQDCRYRIFESYSRVLRTRELLNFGSLRLWEIKMEADVTFKFIRTNGVKLHTALSGPEDGEPVILLHGYPDAWFGWAAQIAALSNAGFRVVAPDQRGYNLSDKPQDVDSYAQNTLVKDIIGLAD